MTPGLRVLTLTEHAHLWENDSAPGKRWTRSPRANRHHTPVAPGGEAAMADDTHYTPCPVCRDHIRPGYYCADCGLYR